MDKLEQSLMYKVKNESGNDIYLSWNLDLLSDEDLAAWNSYKDSPDYKGYTPEEISANMRKLEASKLKEWVNSRGMGVAHYEYITNADGTKTRTPEFKFKFAKGEEKTMSHRQTPYFRRMEKKEIVQNEDDKSTKNRIKGKVYGGYYTITILEEEKYKDATRAELMRKCKELGLPFESTAKNDDLKKLINDYEGN